jgi:phosphoribosyl 1,2-cyclic phosphodiesterase
MKIILGGVRGTSCIAQSDYMTYGGETTSVLVEGDAGERVIIDAGTGIRKLGQRIEAGKIPPSILLLITHYHLDHIMGLPSLSLLYRGGTKFRVGSVRRNNLCAREILPQIMAQPFWPVQLEDLESSFEFVDWPTEISVRPHAFGKLEIRWCSVRHPGGCTAYRIDEPATGKSFVFATDFEWGQSTPAEKQMFLQLCREPGPPGLLVLDGQFTRRQYPQFMGWGHSTWEDNVDIARETRARLLVVTHHAPQNTDQRLEMIESELIRELPDAKLGRDGMEIVL